jgi:hypothetical protein
MGMGVSTNGPINSLTAAVRSLRSRSAFLIWSSTSVTTRILGELQCHPVGVPVHVPPDHALSVVAPSSRMPPGRCRGLVQLVELASERAATCHRSGPKTYYEPLGLDATPGVWARLRPNTRKSTEFPELAAVAIRHSRLLPRTRSAGRFRMSRQTNDVTTRCPVTIAVLGESAKPGWNVRVDGDRSGI